MRTLGTLLAILLVSCPLTIAAPDGERLATIPEEFRGTWTHLASGIHPADIEMPLVIMGKKVQGHEWGGDAVSITRTSRLEVTVVVEGWAEGDSYSLREKWKLSPDGQRLQITDLKHPGPARTVYRVKD